MGKLTEADERLWIDSNGFIYSGDGKRLLKGADVRGAYWIPEGVEDIDPEALLGCKIDTLHIPWTAHVHDYDQLVFSLKSATNSHADLFCCLGALFEDSFATADVIMYESHLPLTPSSIAGALCFL